MNSLYFSVNPCTKPPQPPPPLLPSAFSGRCSSSTGVCLKHLLEATGQPVNVNFALFKRHHTSPSFLSSDSSSSNPHSSPPCPSFSTPCSFLLSQPPPYLSQLPFPSPYLQLLLLPSLLFSSNLPFLLLPLPTSPLPLF